MRPGAPGALPVRRALPLLALLEYLLAHLGIAKHGEEHRPAKDISGERWQKERQSRLAEGRKPNLFRMKKSAPDRRWLQRRSALRMAPPPGAAIGAAILAAGQPYGFDV